MNYSIKNIQFVHAKIVWYEINILERFLIIHIENPYDTINKLYLGKVEVKIYQWKHILVTNYLFANKFREERTVEVDLANDMDFFVEICDVDLMADVTKIEGFPKGEGWLIYTIESPKIEISLLL